MGKLGDVKNWDVSEDYFSVAIVKKSQVPIHWKQNGNGCAVNMNKVVFIGAGPGDPELITLKGKKWLEKADVVIYAGQPLNPEYLKYCKKAAELYDSAKMGLPEMLKVMVAGVKAGKLVARLHDGDPSFYGAIQEVMTALRQRRHRVLPHSRHKLPARRRSSTQPRINPAKHFSNRHHYPP